MTKLEASLKAESPGVKPEHISTTSTQEQQVPLDLSENYYRDAKCDHLPNNQGQCHA